MSRFVNSFVKQVAVTFSLVLIIVILTVVNGVKVEVFRKENFEDLLYDSEEASQCSFPQNETAGSIRTDSCIFLYTSHCKYLSIKILPPGVQNLSTVDYEAFGNTLSFFRKNPTYKVCNEENVGAQINVDIYNRSDYIQSWPQYPVTKLASHEDLCSCQNLDPSVPAKGISINNNGNYITVYSKKNCQGRSKVVPAGNTFKSFHAEYFNYEGTEVSEPMPIKSLGPYHHPDHFPSHCTLSPLSSQIFKFHFLGDDSKDKGNQTTKGKVVETGFSSTFRNNGSGTLSQEYPVTNLVEEVVEFDLPSSLRDMEHVQVEDSVDLVSSADVPFLVDPKFMKRLADAYDFRRINPQSESSTSKRRVVNNKEISVKQQIVVPACTAYTMRVNSRKIKNQPIKYNAYLKITGRTETMNNMTATEIRNHMHSGLEYVKDLDEFTVVAVATGVMKAEYGLHPTFSGKGVEIPGCKAACLKIDTQSESSGRLNPIIIDAAK